MIFKFNYNSSKIVCNLQFAICNLQLLGITEMKREKKREKKRADTICPPKKYDIIIII